MHDVLFTLSLFGRQIPFYAYGLMFGLGCYLGSLLAAHIAERRLGIPRRKLIIYAFAAIGFGLVGGHVHALIVDHTLVGVGLLDGTGFTYYASALAGTFAALPTGLALKVSPWR